MPSASQAITDILGGRVHAMIDAVPPCAARSKAASSSRWRSRPRQRLPNFPDLPTAAETIPGFEAVGWLALMAPPAHAGAAGAQDQRRPAQRAGQPEFQKRYEELGTYIRPTTPEELTAFIREQQRSGGR